MRSFVIGIFFVLAFSGLSKLYAIQRPAHFIFDEDFHIITAHLILAGDDRAFEWWHAPISQEYMPRLGRPTSIEWLHPPLAKYAQALSIQLLGDNPLGWRASSVVAGMSITLVIILLVYQLTGKYYPSLIAGLLTTLDGLLFVQSRIANNDIYVALWVITALYMYAKLYLPNSKLSLQFQWFLTLLTGITTGLAIASKWSGTFLLLFFAVWELYWWYTGYAKKKNVYALLHLSRYICIVVTAGVIYLSSYLPVIASQGWLHVVQLHQHIWAYQTTAQFEHTYASHPWQWVLNLRPIRYDIFLDVTQHTIRYIYAVGNPVIQWLGVITIVMSAYLSVKKWFATKTLQLASHSYTTLAYICLLLPWWSIERPLFYYHYTAAVPLLIATLVIILHDITLSSTKVDSFLYFYIKKHLMILVVILSICAYIWMLPILAGKSLPLPISTIKQNFFPINSWY